MGSLLDLTLREEEFLCGDEESPRMVAPGREPSWLLPSANWLGKLVDMRKSPLRVHQNTIGAFEAKTHLAALLRQVERGRSFEICRHGKPIARLLPAAQDGEATEPAAVRAGFRAIRRRISGPLKVRRLIEAGRRV